MTNQENRPMDPADLRQKAEALARERAARTPEDSAALSPEEVRKTLHELRVHQIELEMQNEELRAAQAQIEAGRERYFDLYDLAPVGYCTLSEQGLILEANLTAATLLGTNHGTLIKQPISRFILKDDQDIYYLHRKKLFETGELQECELRLVKPDGALFWAHLKANAAQADDSAPVCRVVLSDITERKRAEEELLHSEQKYRNLVENANEAIFVTQEQKLVFVNPKTIALTGYSAEELQPRPFIEFIHQDDREIVLDRHVRRLKGEELPHLYPFRVLHKDGSIMWGELNAVLINWDGKPATLNFLSDITERKQAEEERKKLQAQLAQARKMESIGILAGGIAHNFNNVLMGIQGRASLMMMDKGPSSPDYEHLKGIKEYVKGATELTRDLLGFARGGKYEVKPADMNNLIKHENRMFGCTKKEIRVQGKYEKDLWTVEVDPGQMQQALLNLYVNAWQAMPGGGDLYVQTENVTLDQEYVKPFAINPGRYVKISVTDTGSGMDDATLEKVFDPFFSTKEIEKGSGLGLASVYGIIKNHGGFINAYSEKGIGTTFTIYLPASEKEAVEETQGNDRHEIQCGQGTVLLVDDEDMIVNVGKEMLERLGYQVLIAKSGGEALDIYKSREKDVDLVILDIIMPGLGGGETYDRLKEIDGDVQVLLSSGYSINGMAKEIMDRGCGGFIQKPFTMEELSRKVKETLD